MEKAILKTLTYADIFDYPLTVFEIHKWLIEKKVELWQVEKAVGKMYQVSSIKYQGKYYFLPKRDELIIKRKRREKQSAKFLRKAKILAWFLKLIPWINLVGISGGLAMGNASKFDDIDLFIITAKNRLWISRIMALGLLSLTGQRRKVSDLGRKIAGKLCINTLLEEDKLEQNSKDIYLAHEVLQMKVLWERDGIYSKYLSDNGWAFKFLPNWIASDVSLRGLKGRSNQYTPPMEAEKRLLASSPTSRSGPRSHGSLAMTMENLAKWIQLKIMRKPQGRERIEDGALYFHPKDYRQTVLKEYIRRVSKLISGTS